MIFRFKAGDGQMTALSRGNNYAAKVEGISSLKAKWRMTENWGFLILHPRDYLLPLYSLHHFFSWTTDLGEIIHIWLFYVVVFIWLFEIQHFWRKVGGQKSNFPSLQGEQEGGGGGEKLRSKKLREKAKKYQVSLNCPKTCALLLLCSSCSALCQFPVPKYFIVDNGRFPWFDGFAAPCFGKKISWTKCGEKKSVTC